MSPRTSPLRFAALALLAAPAVASPAWAAPVPAQGPPPTAVRAVRAETRPVVQREKVTGSLRAAAEAVLAAREQGAVEAFDLREGAPVRAGDVLVRLDARRVLAQRAQAVATAAEAEATRTRRDAEVADAEEDLVALEKARTNDAISARELRQARTRLAVAKADSVAARKREEALAAELALLDIRVEDMALRAPFDGVVVERHVEVGEWVSAGDPTVTLVSTDRLEVWLDVPQRLVERVAAAGDALPVRIGGIGADVRALEPRVVPRIDARTRMFPVVARIDGDAARGLSPGMSASSYLPVGEERDTLMLPKDALVYRPGGVAVMTVMGVDEGGATVNGVAAMTPITILFETDREIAVAPGALRPGAVVVVEGNERLFPGTNVAATIASDEREPIR